MINLIKRFALKWFSPYTTMYIGLDGEVTEVHYSWTYQDAVEWAACSLKEEQVEVYKYHNQVAWRSEQY
jgi:hypothetical protein